MAGVFPPQLLCFVKVWKSLGFLNYFEEKLNVCVSKREEVEQCTLLNTWKKRVLQFHTILIERIQRAVLKYRCCFSGCFKWKPELARHEMTAGRL